MNGYDILCVEDNAGDVSLIREAFIHCGLEIRLHAVATGAAALAFLTHRGGYFNSPRPDLILVDLQLPSMNGIKVMNEIRNDDLLNIPIIVLTSSVRPEDIQHSYANGAYLYLLKPNSWTRYVSLCEGLGKLLETKLVRAVGS